MKNQNVQKIFGPQNEAKGSPNLLASLTPFHTEQGLLRPILEVYENCKIQERSIYDVTVSCHEEIVNVIKVIYSRSFVCWCPASSHLFFLFPFFFPWSKFSHLKIKCYYVLEQ